MGIAAASTSLTMLPLAIVDRICPSAVPFALAKPYLSFFRLTYLLRLWS
jgi:hypothetical protein